ncbi:MAG: fibronectin type III domain-containing protein, partial [Thermoplasmata archaeon]|nr:fibronectin type III domain-containing protein [Thermoplasmata archaeon]
IVLGHFQALGAYGASFGKMAIDPGTANLLLPGSFSAPTTALSLPTLNIAHTYSSYASYSGSTVANPMRGTFVTFGQYPTQLQARVEATGAVAWTTPLPSFAPASLEPPMAIDTQAGVVFLADGVSGNVLTVNADTGSPGAAIPLPLGMNVTALAVDSLHHFLYVAENPGQVQVFSSVTGALAGTAMTPFLTACAGTADSVRLAAYFVNCQPNGNVTTVRSGTFNTGTIYAVGNDPTSIVLDPSGELIVANFVSDNLTTIALANGARAAIPLGPGNPLLLAEDVPDGLLAVADGSSALVQMLNVSDGLPYANAWAGNATGGLTFDNTSGAFVLVGLNTSSATVWSRLSVPSAPGGPVVVASNNTLSVNWTAVAGANGQVLYNVTLAPSVGAPMRLINTSALQHTFTGLTDGVVYAVTVTAGNFVGTGPSAGPVDAAPIGTPYPPSSISATAHGSSAVVVWGAPASTDGSPVTNYTLEYALGTGPVLSISEGTVLSATIPGLLPGSFYTFHVIAWNAAGASNSSAAAALATPTSSVSVPGGFAG